MSNDIDRQRVIAVARRLQKMADSLDDQVAIADWWPETLRENVEELREAAALDEVEEPPWGSK